MKLPEAWMGMNFMALAYEISKPEYDGLDDDAIAERVNSKHCRGRGLKWFKKHPMRHVLGWDRELHYGDIIHAKRGGGI